VVVVAVHLRRQVQTEMVVTELRLHYLEPQLLMQVAVAVLVKTAVVRVLVELEVEVLVLWVALHLCTLLLAHHLQVEVEAVAEKLADTAPLVETAAPASSSSSGADLGLHRDKISCTRSHLH
jgi:uncharacterized paraquat-inducible protein A